MSSITTEFRAPVTRSSALRAADGVIAGYIRSLSQAAPEKPRGIVVKKQSSPLAAQAYRCGASHGKGVSARRRPALRRVPAPA